MGVGTTDRVGHQDERVLLAEVRVLFGAVDPWLARFSRDVAERLPVPAPPQPPHHREP
ncbi:hypothetical protein [Yinghuangia seranimata]|uniref:hypothetical protein n=1 Tax=Yinghuangia seranimata TaxID=408067 RepID=UPI00248BB2E5|nr:hypothetical protein [Yinghuangia seranimata]MDI2128699.1 hypothetical protein [Yinghuangia seranimata]